MPPTTEQKLAMLRKMWLIRHFELQARQLFMRNLVRGSSHMYIGQEGVAVGVCSTLTDNDYITSTHRGHGHCLAKGGDPNAMMAELLGRATGYCKGKGGSMHIADLDLGILGANGIVGGGLGLAAGAAFASQYNGNGRVAVAFFGDGAINQGAFHETANLAGMFKLPLIFMCERNRFAEFGYADYLFADLDLTKRSLPFGFPSCEVDGNDVLAVHETTGEAVRRARAGEGPTLIVAETYRMDGHIIGDPLTYRDKAEWEAWKEKDPIDRLGRHLVDTGALTDEQSEKIEDEVRAQVLAAVEFALNSPDPDLSTLHEDVYA